MFRKFSAEISNSENDLSVGNSSLEQLIREYIVSHKQLEAI